MLIPKSFSQESSLLKENNDCNTCTVIPGQLAKFKDALTDSKLHYYTNEGTTKLDLKKAELECNINYFSVCKDLMILTSSGKTKDRTEIRQDKNLSLNSYSAMHFSAVFENVPSSNSRKGVTIGQIHNDTKGVKRPLLRVEIAGGNAIKVIVTDSYLKNKGNVDNVYLTSFDEKDHLDCKIEIKGTNNEISVIVKNITKGISIKRSFEVSDMWQQKDGNFYYKAGAYTQVSGPKTKVSYNKFQFIYK